jgi:hypothetical protein
LQTTATPPVCGLVRVVDVAARLCRVQPSAMLDRRMFARAGAEIRRRGAAALVAGAIVSTSPVVLAGPAEQLPTVEQDPVHTPAPVVEEGMSSAERLERARSLYERGRGKFETFDYIGAIEFWTQAYTELPETDEFASIRAKLMFNIAAARLSAFEIDDNIAHLRQAKRLMDLYVDSIGDATDEEAADARAWQEKISARLTEAEAERKKNQPATKAPPRAEPGPDPKEVRRARIFTIAGATTLSVGVAALGAMAGGLIWGERLRSDGASRAGEPGTNADDLGDVVDKGKTANAMALGTGIAGGVLIGAGIGLLVYGLVKTKKLGGGGQRAVVPVAAPGFVGVSGRWRF